MSSANSISCRVDGVIEVECMALFLISSHKRPPDFVEESVHEYTVHDVDWKRVALDLVHAPFWSYAPVAAEQRFDNTPCCFRPRALLLTSLDKTAPSALSVSLS